MDTSPDMSNAGNEVPAAKPLAIAPAPAQGFNPCVPEQARHPTNLQGLLRCALAATTGNPNEEKYEYMDEERRKFLEEAMKNLSVDFTSVLTESINVLSDRMIVLSVKEHDPMPEIMKRSFHNLLEYVDDIDVATSFYKLGGFKIFPVCLDSGSAAVRARACAVLAEVCQNNRPAQAHALQLRLLPRLLDTARAGRGPALAKALYAISCVCREFEPACRELVDQEGCAVLVPALRASDAAVRAKAAFFIRYLYLNYPESWDKFKAEGIVWTVSEQIRRYQDNHDKETTSHMLALLRAMVEKNPRILKHCRDPDMDLKEALQGLGNAEDEELVGDSQDLIMKIFTSEPSDKLVLEQCSDMW